MSTLPPAPPAPAPGPPPWPRAAPSRQQRWPMFASLVIALVAMGLAIVCWFRPPPSNNASSTPPTPSYTDQQVATAKANVCGAFDKVQHAADFAKTHVGSNDYTTQLATAALTHVALDAGSRY